MGISPWIPDMPPAHLSTLTRRWRLPDPPVTWSCVSSISKPFLLPSPRYEPPPSSAQAWGSPRFYSAAFTLLQREHLQGSLLSPLQALPVSLMCQRGTPISGFSVLPRAACLVLVGTNLSQQEDLRSCPRGSGETGRALQPDAVPL